MPLSSDHFTDTYIMMMVEVVAATMLFLIALTVGGLVLNWLLQRMIEASFAKTARVAASDIDEQFRRFNGYTD